MKAQLRFRGLYFFVICWSLFLDEGFIFFLDGILMYWWLFLNWFLIDFFNWIDTDIMLLTVEFSIRSFMSQLHCMDLICAVII